MIERAYRLVPNAAVYDVVELLDNDGHHAFDAFDGHPLKHPFRAPRARLAAVDRRGDFPSLSWRIPVLSERAWRGLAPQIADEVEALPIRIGEDRYFALNVFWRDCLDELESEIQRDSSGRILSIRRYVLRPDLLGDRSIFKLPQSPGEVLVTPGFRSLVEELGLEGAIFQSLERPARPAPAV